MNRRQLQPYPGLRPFERRESRIFFGRQTQVDELLQRLKDRHFLAVLGASGSGKSSLVKAGLLAGLEKGYMGEVGASWRIAELRPGDQPFERLAEGLVGKIPLNPPFAKGEAGSNSAQSGEDGILLPSFAKGGAGGGFSSGFLAAQLRRGSRSLHDYLSQSPLEDGQKLLILADQFEEIFRYRQQSGNQAAAFVALLLEACRHPDIYVVITMRSDFLGEAAAFHGLPEAINDGLYLTPRLTREQLREAIALPAKLFGGAVDEALINQLLNEAGNNPDQLPLLQHALLRLWVNDADKRLTLAEYQQLDGLRGALDGHLEQVYGDLDPRQQAMAETLFRALTQREADGQDVRRPVRVADVLALAGCSLAELAAVVDAFRGEGRHFLVASTPQLAVDSVLDISHESLIRQWRRLQGWLAEEVAKVEMYQRLRDAAQRRASDAGGELWRGTDLALARDWKQKHQPDAVWALRYDASDAAFAQAMAFLEESAAAEEAQLQAEKHRQQAEIRRSRRLLVYALIGLVIAVGLALWAMGEREQRTVQLFDSDTTHAALMAKMEDYAAAREKLKHTQDLNGEVEPERTHARDLLAGYVDIMGGSAERTFTDADDKPLPQLTGNVAISPDGKWLAASGERGTIALFERASGKLVQKLEGHDPKAGSNRQGTVWDIVFHPKQPWLFSAGDDGQIIQWQLPQAGAEARVLDQWKVDAGAPVWALALSPDGRVLASGYTDGKIRLWDVKETPPNLPLSGEEKERKPLRMLEGHEGPIPQIGLTFDPQGRWLASASYDNTARIWDWKTGKEIHRLQGRRGVAFNSDGSLLAASNYDNSILLWNSETGEQIGKPLKGHQNMVFGLQFINDQRLTSASSDNTVRLWDVATGVTRRVLQGHTAAVAGLALYADKGQRWLYSNSNDGTVKQWEADLPGQWLVDLPGAATASAISPDGKHLVVGLQDGGMQVYALPDVGLKPDLQQEIKDAHGTFVLRFAFNKDGSLLASSSHDETAKIWKVGADGKLVLEHTIEDHTNSVYAVAFSLDNTRLATASYDGRIGLFDLESGKGKLFEAHDGNVASVNFDQSGKYLASAGIQDFTLKLWDISGDKPQLLKSEVANDKLLWASLSPDGKQLASVGREATVTVYPTHGGQEPLRLNGHEQAVYKAIFSPDSRQLATVSWDMTVRLWDLDTRSELFSLRLPTTFDPNHGPLWDFDFRCTPTGCWIAVPLTSGKLALYKLGEVDYGE
ncbi:hypothetical protein [Thiothrix nivea]|uniref:WD40 repeat-containing protein n=1 Tax=Thiothrix nivea (strain ATCC 35100 / DSM 5205 / JP2) TaxID=870187 RepID=A0A656HJX1_THINJ|nr:hypothetical protein [Thiothrix nivea]EIJ36593.1 WD40 repeat-containing protein [Thiothrix nivea DSM 5205]